MTTGAVVVLLYLVIVSLGIGVSGWFVWLRLRGTPALKYFALNAGGTAIAGLLHATGWSLIIIFHNQFSTWGSAIFILPAELLRLLIWAMLAGYSGGMLNGIHPVHEIMRAVGDGSASPSPEPPDD